MTQLTNGATPKYDVLVLGGGPAGASAALEAARAGLRVGLIDKRRFPRDKLCGGALTGRALKTFQRVFQQELPDVPIKISGTMDFHGFGQDLGRDADAPPLYLGMRRALDQSLLQAAIEAGTETFLGETPQLDLDARTVRIGGRALLADVIIAADGVASPTARMLFGQAYDQRTIGFALEVELEGADASRMLRIDFGAAEWGYGWQFPKEKGTTIGLGGLLSRNRDMKAQLAAYLTLLNVAEVPKVKGHFLPFGDFRRVPGRGNVLLAGDAAGLVDPITGEGIGHAMDSGSLAALATVEAIALGRPEEALARYRRSLQPIHQSLRHARVLRHLIFRPALRPVFVRNFRRSQRLRSEYLRLMAGETDYGDLLRLTARRLPAAVLRSLTSR